MQFSNFLDKYPTYSFTLAKNTTRFNSVDEIIAVLEDKISADPIACQIAVFDHHAHTSALPNGEIAENIQAAKSLVFCFGIKLPSPQAMAPRPRSFGVCELTDSFVITFMQAPNPQMNEVMQGWVKALAE
ncbi:DUF6858 family protein [Thiopseudomonas acetoxidans]|uniref:Uncharacterized protein n=1 Tax=Thiopseudomonas acetoxidans TaxID=3041622 RepID=A0ABT7SQV9_9GAMM|nr:hypothetical protein [Thiopseudomonas sp. CY1220]MDM7858583.1 hypothetical protein [Thiopseudomonas sp. CY1220]